MVQAAKNDARSPQAQVRSSGPSEAASPSSGRRPDRRALAGLSYDQQVQMLAPSDAATGTTPTPTSAPDATTEPQLGGCGGGGGGPVPPSELDLALAPDKPDVNAVLAALRKDSGILTGAERECAEPGNAEKEKGWHDTIDARAAADPICQELARKFAGDADAVWRARNLRLFGPEATWPPELRMNTIAIVKFARREAEAMGKPKNQAAIAHIADLLRPLDPVARAQIVAQWITVPNVLGPKGWDRTDLEQLQAQVAGTKYAMTPELGQAPNIPWDTWTNARIFDYFTREVFPALGYRFEPTKRNVVNIRGFVLTKSAGSEQEIAALQNAATDGHIFVLWRNGEGGKGDPQVHRGWDWTTSGSGRGNHLSQSARYQRDTSVRGDKEFTGAGRSTDLRPAAGPAAGKDEAAGALAEKAKGAAERADQGLTQARTLKAWKDDAAPGRRLSKEQVAARKANAGSLIDSAKGSYDAAGEAIALVDAAKAAKARAPQGAPEDPALAETAARAKVARKEAEALHKEGVDRWYIAQLRAEGGPPVPGEGGASAVLMEGQYEAKYGGQSQIENHDDWSINAGVNRYDKGGNPEGPGGMAPAHRDVTGDGRMSQEERGIGAPVAGGIKFHSGSGSGSSEGCQVSGKEADFAQFEGLMRTDRASGKSGARPEDFAYMLIDARRLPTPKEAAATAPSAARA